MEDFITTEYNQRLFELDQRQANFTGATGASLTQPPPGDLVFEPTSTGVAIDVGTPNNMISNEDFVQNSDLNIIETGNGGYS